MKILSFDLSTTCTGVVGAELNNDKITFIKTFSIVPKIDREAVILKLGYLPSKRRIHLKSGTTIQSYVRPQNDHVTKTEKKKRDVEVRNATNSAIKQEMSIGLNQTISSFNPDLILVERNESFKGVLTTKLLAEARGILEGAAKEVPIKSYNVISVRSHLDLATLVQQYVDSLADASQLSGMTHITKYAIKHYLEKKYKINCNNTDESDALAVFDYYYETEVKKK